MKTSHTINALRYWPAPNSFHLAFIHLNAIGSDYIPQESDLISDKGALLKVPMEFLLFQDLNDLFEVAQAIFFCLAVNEDIIKVDHHKSTNEGPENMVH